MNAFGVVHELDRPDGELHASIALHAVVVDNEVPAREELAFMLRDDPRVGWVHIAGSAGQALRLLNDEHVDVVFCDIELPGLDGIELARVVRQFAHRPGVVFVTAHADRALDAFDVEAVDYLVKPVHADRLAEAVRRAAQLSGTASDHDETIAVELAGVTRFIRRSQVRYVEAHGDYARLHTASESHLVRTPLSVLEARWAGWGFVRIHRSTLVALEHVDEVRVVGGCWVVRLGRDELRVSRRHTRDLREWLGLD